MASAYPSGGEGPEATREAYSSAAGLISSLTGGAHHTPSIGANNNQYSPALDLLHLPLSGQTQQTQSAAGPAGSLTFGGLGAGLRSGPFGPGSGSAPGKAPEQEKQLCTFFLRTGTCAYGDRCKFKHPADRPPPQLNARGYPVRADEPDCAHYLKKGWCAFGPTCKFNHPEMPILSSYGLTQPPTAYVSLPTTTFPSPAVYSVPSAVPTLYYLPPGMSPNQLAGSAVGLLPSNVGAVAATQASQLAFPQQSALAATAPGQMYRQPAPSVPYAGMGGAIGSSMGMGMGGAMTSNVSVLQEAFQGLTLGRAGGLGQRK